MGVQELGYFEKAIFNIERVAELKRRFNPDVLFGISLIIDERNIESLPDAINILTSIQERRPNAIDNILVRPVMKFSHLDKRFGIQKENTNQKLFALLKEGAPLYNQCEDRKILLIARTDSFEDSPPEEEYHGFECLSYGWFGQIQYNGDVQLCSETFCDPRYTIGNVPKNTLSQIWRGDRRKNMINRVNREKCFLNKCQHNSRGHQLNRMFNQIENFRTKDKMDKVVKWIRDLRRLTIPPSHSFFM